jgi:hypothetical protein
MVQILTTRNNHEKLEGRLPDPPDPKYIFFFALAGERGPTPSPGSFRTGQGATPAQSPVRTR